MIGALNSSSVSVLSAQQMQAQRDAQTARAKAERLQAQSQQASEDARRATERSEGLDKQSRAFGRVAEQAQKVADQQPASNQVSTPPPTTNKASTPKDDPLPTDTLTTTQQLGRSILAQANNPLASSAAAARTYQQMQATSGNGSGASRNLADSASGTLGTRNATAASIRVTA
jgi:hypothetical protein